MTSEQMLKAKLPPGCIFRNVANLGQKPRWVIVPAPPGWFDWETPP